MNHYDTMGLAKTASQDEVKKAFRSLAQKHHPDKGGDEKRFKQITEAYATLGNPEKRKEYDRNMGITLGPTGARSHMTENDINNFMKGAMQDFTKYQWEPTVHQTHATNRSMQDILRDAQRATSQSSPRPSKDDVARAFREKMGPGFFTTN